MNGGNQLALQLLAGVAWASSSGEVPVNNSDATDGVLVA
jgi:hypothetical protein